MCGPVVLEAVAKHVNRRDFLKLAGIAEAAGMSTSLMGATEVLAAPRTVRFRRMQDLTHTLKPGFPSFSGQPVFKTDVAVTIKKDGYYALNISYFEHIGTHMDAPAHFGATAKTV